MNKKKEETSYVVIEEFKNNKELSVILIDIIISKLLDNKVTLSDIYGD